MPHSTDAIKRKIRDEILARGWSFVIPHIPLWFIFILYAPSLYFQNLVFQIGLSGIVLGTLLFACALIKSQRDPSKTKSGKMLFTAMAALGLGWTLIMASMFQSFGLYGVPTLITFIIFCGLGSAGLITLSTDKKIFFTFFGPIFFGTLGGAIPYAHNLIGFTIISLITLYIIFLVLAGASIRKTFLASVKGQLLIAGEKNRMEALIDALPGIVSVIDSDLIYQAINHYGKTIVGDLVGKKVGHHHGHSDFVQKVESFMGGNEQKFLHEMEVETNTGPRPFLVSMSRVPEQNLAILVSIPIDELVQTRQEGLAMKAKAEYAARLGSLGEMAQGIAHEINNPLSIAIFAAEEILTRIKNEEANPAFITTYLDKVLKSCHRIAKIVRSLRYFSRDADQDPRKSLPLAQILDQAMDVCTERCKRYNINLIYTPPSLSILVHCQEVPMVQVFINLINNAFDAVEKTASPWIRIDHSVKGQDVIVCVSDSGPGIPADVRKRIMEPFYTTKDVNQGTGLGLSISLGIMESNGGSIRLDDESMHTNFIVTIPLATAFS